MTKILAPVERLLRRQILEFPPKGSGRAAGLFAAALLASASARGQQTTERVSVDSSGAQGNDLSYFGDITHDGRCVAFSSVASNLVPGDTNGDDDAFVHDLSTGVTERVSVDSSGNQGSLGAGGLVTISDDGRYAAFSSHSSNLVSGDTNFKEDVFVHDRQTGATERISVDSSGNQGNDHSLFGHISGDGRYVVFFSWATNLVLGDTNGVGDIFVHDRLSGVTERVSVDSSGNQGNGESSGAEIAEDGDYVVFSSNASNLVPNDTNGAQDCFFHDRVTRVTERVSLDSSGNQGNGSSSIGGVSDDGRYVSFTSDADNLVPNDTNGVDDGFLRNRQTGMTERISVDLSGNQGNGISIVCGMSGDGRYIVLGSLATNFVQGDTNGCLDAFVHDHVSGVLDLVSVDSSGVQANASLGSFPRSISGDGRYVVFYSSADNLVASDTNGVEDVFVRDRSCTDQFVNYCTAGFSASGCAVRLRSDGIPSPSAGSGFTAIAAFVEGQKDGLFFYGQNGQQASPWGNGTSFQCVVPPVKRGGLQVGNGTVGVCDSIITQDLNALWCPSCPKPAHAPIPGKKLQIQFWYRDPLNTSNQSTSLSDAIEVTPCP